MLHEINPTSLERFAAQIPAETPVFMLNLLRFRADGGREKFFNAYVPAFREVMAALGVDDVAPTWTGDIAGFVAGPDEERWDGIVIVRYATLGAFRAIVDSELYRTHAAPHRIAALEDWRLIAHTETPLPV